MDLTTERISPAFVGVAFHDKIIFNIVERDPEFTSTGLSVISHLKNDKNKFVASIIESQSYDSIKYIFDDEIKFGSFYDLTNENNESYLDIFRLINAENIYEFFYIYDLASDTLIVKIPESPTIIALDYKKSQDTRDLVNLINNNTLI